MKRSTFPSRTHAFHRAALVAATVGLALGGLAQTAGAVWLYAPLTSGKPSDAGSYGVSYVAVEGDRALVSAGAFGAFTHLVTYTGTGSGMAYDREQVTTSSCRGVALLNGEAWVACGTELRRYSRLSLGVWILQQSWNLNNQVYDVAADGNVVVCSYAVSSTGGSMAVLEKRSGTWGMYYTVNSSVDYFGEHVDVIDLMDYVLATPPYTVHRNSRIIVSGRGSDSPSTNAGAAYIYEQSGDSWPWAATLNAPSPASGDEFGAEVALDGSYAYVSNLGSGSVRGQVVAFQKSGSSWSAVATISPSYAAADFGRSLDADANRAVIGQSGSTYGKAYLFARSGTAWSWSTTFASRDSASDPSFGSAVAIDGSRVLVGGGDYSTGQGNVYFFGER